MSPLSSVHGIYLPIDVSQVAVNEAEPTHLKTTSVGNVSPGLRVVILARMGWRRLKLW